MARLHCLDVCRGLLRIILVIVNVIVAVLGLLVMVVGIWAMASGDMYFDIVADDKEIAQIPVLLIVVGAFVLLLGIVGVIGAICAGTIGGRIILGLYGFVLALVVVCELAGGIAAGVLKDKLSSSFEESAAASLANYKKDTSVQDAWDSAQEELKCCGNNNYTDYADIFNNGSVPLSCCNTSYIDEVEGGPTCDVATQNAALYSAFIYQKGCTSKVEELLSRNLAVIAGVSIVFGIMQIVGVVISCFVAIARRSEESSGYEHV